MSSNEISFKDIIKEGWPNTLASFFYIKKGGRKFASALSAYTGNMLIDSGAFSVWAQGHHIALSEYMDFCHAFKALSRARHLVFINLDVIPGRIGSRPSRHEVTSAIDESMRNWETLKASGLEVMPVFHEGEPLSVLRQIIGALAPGSMIGLSPRQKGASDSTMRFFDNCFAVLGEDCIRGRGLRPHSLGITSPKALKRYPFFSADAAAWLWGSAVGRVSYWNGRDVISLRYQEKDKHTAQTILGIDGFKTSKALAFRRITFIRALSQYQEHLTSLWALRGIIWPDEEV